MPPAAHEPLGEPTGSVVGDALQLRQYNSSWCGTVFTLPDMYATFAFHSVEWSLMGKDNAWRSVLTGVKEVSAETKSNFYLSGKAHVQMLVEVVTAPNVEAELKIYAQASPSACTYRPVCSLGYLHSDHRLSTPTIVGTRHLLLRARAEYTGMRTSGQRPSERPKTPLFGRVLDFGCGLGRIGFAFVTLAQSVTCVDQSGYHLRLAQKEWKHHLKNRSGSDGEHAHKLHFVLSSPDLLLTMRSQHRRFDFVHSVIVIQHMVPQLQQIYLEQMCDLLVPGGQGWVQIPIKWSGNTAKETCDLKKSQMGGGMKMHFTPAKHVVTILESRGCTCKVMNVAQMCIGDDNTPGIESGIVTFIKGEYSGG